MLNKMERNEVRIAHGCYYPYNKNVSKTTDTTIINSLRLVEYLYLCDAYTKEVELDFNNKNLDISRMLEGLFKLPKIRYENRVDGRLYDKTCGVYISILYSEQRAVLTFVRSDIKKQLSEVFILRISYKEETDEYLVGISNCPLYYSRNHKIAKTTAFANQQVVYGIIPDDVLSCIDQFINMMIDDANQFELMIPDYNKQETSLFRMIFRELKSTRFFEYETYTNKNMSADSVWIFDKNDNVILNMIDNDWDECPLLDFNEREMKFVNRYCNEYHKLQDEFDDRTFNINEYVDIKNMRYGNIYRYKHSSGNILLINVIKHADDLLITIVDDTQPMVYGMVSIIFINLSNFDLNRSLHSVVYYTVLKNFENIPYSIRSVKENSVVLGNSLIENMEIVEEFLRMIVVIHDRPKRSKMIVGKKSVKYHSSGTTHAKKESDVKIVRILKPHREAVNMIEQHTGTRCEYEYTMESWDRIGHWRTMKNGRTVWIKETECHRRKELTHKEIQIKL